MIADPGLTFGYGRPLGPHPVLLELLDERITEVLAAAERADTAVVLVGRGATDPDANADIAKTARLSVRGPRLPDRRDRPSSRWPSRACPRPSSVLGCWAPGAIVVVSVLPLLRGAAGPGGGPVAARGRPSTRDVEVRNAAVLGPDERHRPAWCSSATREVLGGDVRMSCDTCIYRIAMPGYEAKVGAPQRAARPPRRSGRPSPPSPRLTLPGPTACRCRVGSPRAWSGTAGRGVWSR